MLAVQRQFIERLNGVTFAAAFYKAIIGTTDLSELLNISGRLIAQQLQPVQVAFFLRKESGFDMHMLESDHPISLEEQGIENSFTESLVENVCKANRPCSLEDLFSLGLEGNPAWLGAVRAGTVPLSSGGKSIGFVLICRAGEKPMNTRQLTYVSAVAEGLSRAIGSCTAAYGIEE